MGIKKARNLQVLLPLTTHPLRVLTDLPKYIIFFQGPDDVGGHVKMNLRSMCCALALTICLCTSPARLTEISGGDFKLWPGHQIIFFFTPRLLIYGQTVIFIGVYAYHYPRFYQGAKIAAARLWSCRTIPGKIVTGQDDDHKEPLS